MPTTSGEPGILRCLVEGGRATASDYEIRRADIRQQMTDAYGAEMSGRQLRGILLRQAYISSDYNSTDF
ncbi:hypothetical protein VTL71DRAFT_5023 [Oculimacula yallundae]|uniref:Uncharacterized protein n=1 Tax=Oculimacula yallundae TaxID=86028 RepID=A0ABR4BZY8_9HELO